MAPEIAAAALADIDPGALIVDPMAGSGTTLFEAARQGYRCIGIDTDPLAVRIANVSFAQYDPTEFEFAAKAIYRELRIKDKRSLPIFPEHFDRETREFARYWFPLKNLRALTFIANSVRDLRDPWIRMALEVALSGTIIVKRFGASFARDVAHSRPHIDHDYKFTNAEDLFLRQVYSIAAYRRNVPQHLAASAILGDARKLPFEHETVDAIITSPPYLNAIDYMRGHRLSLIWLGHTISELRITRSRNIGTEKSDVIAGQSRSWAIRSKYERDLESVLRECVRVVRPGGKLVLIVADNSGKSGTFSCAAVVTKLALDLKLTHLGTSIRAIPSLGRYLPPPSALRSSALDNRMQFESVISFRRVS